LVTGSLFAQLPRSITTKDVTVSASIRIDKSGAKPKAVISWKKHDLALQYTISRKLKSDVAWYSVASLDTNILKYADESVQSGKMYEYQVNAVCYGTVHDNTLGKDSVRATEFQAFSYLYAGVDAETPGYMGKVLLLIEDAISSELATEIATLKNDLINEGWTPIIRYVPRTEVFNKDAVKAVKAIVMEEYNKDKANLNTVFILGRVAVPYSGDNNPDGHGDHKGAWPADLYYGSTTADINWTDKNINDVSASRAENKNIPGDGKFDNTSIPSDITIRVGRVDFYNMSDFTETETELLRRYLVKDHKFRIGETRPIYRGLVSDGFGMYTLECFGSSGWRNEGSLLGPDSVRAGTWFTVLGTDSYIWASGNGGGTYSSAGSIGSTKDFATKPVNSIFTTLFGSYFGDWDSKNNFLRAPLASSPTALTCAWSARPHWFFHHMAMNEPIGYSALISQNNRDTYYPNVFSLLAYPSGVVYSSGSRNTHVALMGDPTLVQYPAGAFVPPVTKLTITQPPLHYIKLTWEPPDVSGFGFNVYRSSNADGPWTKLNSAMLTGTEYRDSNIVDAKVYYMVRACKLMETNSGSFYNQSIAVIGNIVATDVNDAHDFELSLSVMPNPAVTGTTLSVSLPQPENISLAIFDASGSMVADYGNMTLNAGVHSIGWDLRSSNAKVAPGIYFAKMTTNSYVKVAKIIVLP
jgi:hypothetical protein